MSVLGCSAEETEAQLSNPIFDEKWPAYEAKMKVAFDHPPCAHCTA